LGKYNIFQGAAKSIIEFIVFVNTFLFWSGFCGINNSYLNKRGVMVMHTIETDRLLLRPIQLQDADELFELASEPEVSRYLTWNTHKTIKETREFIRDSVRKNRRRKYPVIFTVVLKDTSKVIGVKSLLKIDLRKRTAEVGTWLGQPFWGKGFSTEINRIFIRYGFEKFGLKCIVFCASVDNKASWNVAEKLKFEFVCEKPCEELGRIKCYTMTRERWEAIYNS